MTRILGLGGKLGSGKSTVANFLVRNAEELFGKGAVVKRYSFAFSLKNFLVEYLDVNPAHVFGTQEEKNQHTHLLWENMPHYEEIRAKVYAACTKTCFVDGIDCDDANAYWEAINAEVEKRVPKGPMTGREVLEQIGTEVMRRIYGPVWINICIKQIKREAHTLAVIDDMRFPNEAEAIRSAGGRLVHLNRTTEEAGLNTHASNTSLDNYPHFDLWINNQHFNITETNARLLAHLDGWDWTVPRPEEDNVGYVNVLGNYLPK